MTWQIAALAHAQQAFPREACGLVVVRKGRARFWPCRNDATRADAFELNAEDYAAAEDDGQVVGVFHSHCHIPATPSEADLVMCERGRLPWHIVSLPNEVWFEFKPSGYRPPLVGRPFSHGVLDCYSLVRDWYLEERGIALPDFRRRDDWWLLGDNLYLDNYRAAGFAETSLDGVQRGDVLLMQVASNVPNHAAVYLGDDMILHHVHGRLSSRDVFAGYWRKHTVKALRHAA